MLRVTLVVVLISFAFAIRHHNGDPKSHEPTLDSLAEKVAEILKPPVEDMKTRKQFTKEALRSEGQKTEAKGLLDAKINSEELKELMDRIKNRDEHAERAPALIYNKLIKKVNKGLDRQAKNFLRSAIESSVKTYILKQEQAGTPIQHKEGETTIQELADRVVGILKTIILEMAKSDQLSKEVISDKARLAEAANAIEEKLNSPELKKNMDRIEKRDPKAEIAPTLICDKLLQNLQGQLGDDPKTAEDVVELAVKPAVKNFIIKQETVVPPQNVKEPAPPKQEDKSELVPDALI